MTTIELRNTPVQARSRSRLEQIAAATRLAIADIGYERFTTADVAERAGCSIGTVYRYVPDRVALLDLVDPDRYVFTEARMLPGIPDGMAPNDHLQNELGHYVSTVFDPDPRAERTALVRVIRAAQAMVVALDAENREDTTA